MASLNPYETLKQQGLAASSFIAGRHRYDALVERHAPKQSSAHKPGRRHSRVYSATLSPHNNQAHVPQKSLAEQLKQAPNTAAQAKILVDAVKQNPRLINDGKLWQSLKWEGKFIGNVAGLNTLPLNKIKLNGADFQGADLRHANLEGAQINGAKFAGAQMGEANMTGAQALGATFAGADLNGATLSGANLTNTNLNDATLKGVQARGVNLSGSFGADVQISGNLQDAKFTGVHYTNAAFGAGQYDGADFTGAKLLDPAGLTALKGVEEGKRPTVSFTSAAVANATAPIPPSEQLQKQRLQPKNVAALKTDAALSPERPKHQPTKQWAMHPSMAPAPAA